MIICKKEHHLLQVADSEPYELVAQNHTTCPILVVCDHASFYVPIQLKALGLDAHYFRQHIAYDIGAAGVSRHLIEQLSASGVLAGFSRLVIDANRFLSAHDSIPKISDGVVIEANTDLTLVESTLRMEELFIPYHDAINRSIARIMAHFSMPLIFSVHSFTPVFDNNHRPWEIGVLWDGDDGVASMLIEYLLKNSDFRVGENEPYHACNPVGYTMKTHAEAKHYPHGLVEIRQDLIVDEAGQIKFATLLAGALSHVLQMLDTTLVKI